MLLNAQLIFRGRTGARSYMAVRLARAVPDLSKTLSEALGVTRGMIAP